MSSIAATAASWISGELLEFRAVPDAEGQFAAVTFQALIENRGADRFSFAPHGHPYRRLRLNAVGQPEWDSGPAAGGRPCGAKESSWVVHHLQEAAGRVSISIETKKGGRFFLAPPAEKSCQLGVSPRQVFWDACIPQVNDQQSPSSMQRCSLGGVKPSHTGHLSEEELCRFVRDGFVVLHSLVPTEAWVTAKAFINGRLGNLAAVGACASHDGKVSAEEVLDGGKENIAVTSAEEKVSSDGIVMEKETEEDETVVDPAGQKGVRHAINKAWGSSSWQLVGLCRCGSVVRALEQLLGQNQFDPRFGAQVALRFPGIRDDVVLGGAAVQWQVSGRDWHTDGLRQGRKHPFTLLVGVALSDVLEPDQGNLCVWPGSHYFAQEHSRWPDGKFRRADGWETSDGPLPDLGQPQQLLLRAGDVVLAHSELAHCGGPLRGHDIRYMVYFRVSHRGLREMRAADLPEQDMWCDLPGVAGLAAAFCKDPDHS